MGDGSPRYAGRGDVRGKRTRVRPAVCGTRTRAEGLPPATVGQRPGRERGSGSAAHRNDGHTVDALALGAEEGRGHAAIRPGEALAASDPGESEWGNPPGVVPWDPGFGPEGNRGN